MTFRPLLAVAAAALLLAGCGDADDPPSPPAAPPEPASFPRAGGRSLEGLRAGRPAGPVISQTQRLLEPAGRRPVRFGFGLFDRARAAIDGAQVALYVAPFPRGPARGPFVARSERVDPETQYRSQSTAADKDSTHSFYVARVPFPRAGRYRVLTLTRLDGRIVASDVDVVEVGSERAGPPKVGERAIRVHTPTEESVGGDVEKIDTRVPPSDLHEDDLADVLGEKPVLLLFATPLLCQTRVCGPVVDLAEQVKADVGDDAAFIHMEIYAGNRVAGGFRPQVKAWRLPTEPWAFAIDRHGRIAERIEGAFSADELERAVRKAIDAR